MYFHSSFFFQFMSYLVIFCKKHTRVAISQQRHTKNDNLDIHFDCFDPFRTPVLEQNSSDCFQRIPHPIRQHTIENIVERLPLPPSCHQQWQQRLRCYGEGISVWVFNTSCRQQGKSLCCQAVSVRGAKC